MAYEFLKTRVTDRVGWLEYHHPPLNAFHWEMLGEVRRALDAFLDDPGVRVVVFASAVEKYFSVGADIRMLQAMGREGMRRWATLCHDLVRRLRDAHKPLLAAIHGTAVGAGLEIVLHGDVRFAAADARLGQPEINIAILPAVGTTQSLARLLGRSRALRFLYEGALVAADEARAMGLVEEVVPGERLRERVQEYAAALTAKPAATLAAIRRCITHGVEVPFDDGLGIELEALVELAGDPDFDEGLRAFLEKRAPNWK